MRSTVFKNKYRYTYLSTWNKSRVSTPKNMYSTSISQSKFINLNLIPTLHAAPIYQKVHTHISRLSFWVSDLHIRFLLTFSHICQLFYHVENSLQNSKKCRIVHYHKYWNKWFYISTLTRTKTSWYCNLPIHSAKKETQP